jgi:hypothetical protein
MGAAALREGVVAGVEAGARGGAGDLACGRGVRQGHEWASRGGSGSEVAETPRWALVSAFTVSAVALRCL